MGQISAHDPQHDLCQPTTHPAPRNFPSSPNTPHNMAVSCWRLVPFLVLPVFWGMGATEMGTQFFHPKTIMQRPPPNPSSLVCCSRLEPKRGTLCCFPQDPEIKETLRGGPKSQSPPSALARPKVQCPQLVCLSLPWPPWQASFIPRLLSLGQPSGVVRVGLVGEELRGWDIA